MPVDDHPVHEKVKHQSKPCALKNQQRIRSGYWVMTRQYRPDGSYTMGSEYIEHKMSVLCRQVGEKINGKWHDLDECNGCNPIHRDWTYITPKRDL